MYSYNVALKNKIKNYTKFKWLHSITKKSKDFIIIYEAISVFFKKYITHLTYFYLFSFIFIYLINIWIFYTLLILNDYLPYFNFYHINLKLKKYNHVSLIV